MDITNIIIHGISGRMGTSIGRLVEENPNTYLLAGIEKEEYKNKSPFNCPIFTNAEEACKTFAAEKPVMIDFSSPEASLNLAAITTKIGIAHVIGTTGFTEAEKAQLALLAKSNLMFWAPNMSVGINVLLEVLPQLTQLLGDNYDIEMTEIHHNKKKDSPSGTALNLAECLANARNWDLPQVANYHREGIIGPRQKEEIGIQTLRGGDVVGVHTVYFMGSGERIEITHQAHSRENFAQGALRAAQWLPLQAKGKLYSMKDILKKVYIP